jgi:hypothetical protein
LARQAQLKQLTLITGLGISTDSPLYHDARFQKYAHEATEFAKAEIARLATEVGAGVCPPSAAACVMAAARAMLWSAHHADNFNSKESMQADSSMKSHMLAAHELCVREANARNSKKTDAKARIEKRLKKKQQSGGDDE